MKLKNSALQELYDAIINGTITITPYTESPIDRAFRECDDKLSESITFEFLKDLQDRNDILRKSEATLLEANLELASKKRQLEKEIDDAKKDVEYFRHRRDDWMARAKHAEKEAKDLASQYQKLTIENKRLQDANTTLEKANADRTELQEAFDKLSGENRSLNARIDCLCLEVNWYRKHYKEQSDKILGLKSRLNSMYGIKYDKYIQSRDTGYKQGQKDLWDMLKDVVDNYDYASLSAFRPVFNLDDLVNTYDLDRFTKDYVRWQEGKKEKARSCATWECTLEAKIEIDKDLLNKVCGIDSDD